MIKNSMRRGRIDAHCCVATPVSTIDSARSIQVKQEFFRCGGKLASTSGYGRAQTDLVRCCCH